MSAELGWSRTRAHTLDTRSDRGVLIESWPDLRISLPDLNTPLGVRVNVGSGIVRTLRETFFGVGRQQLRTDEDL